MIWDPEPPAVVFSKLTGELFFLGPDGCRYSPLEYFRIAWSEAKERTRNRGEGQR